MVDTVITLVKPGEDTQDATGVWRTGPPFLREIFARMSSISRSEFYSGGQTGHRPEMRFTVFDREYRGEPELIWEGLAYAIYRTFQIPGTDDLELYVERKLGEHVGEENAD